MDGCIYRTKDGECDLYSEGGKYKAFCEMENCEGRKMSNADRIRKMTDEELAEYLFDRGNADEYCYGICIHQDDIYACVNAMKQSKCIQGVIAWLKKECDDNGT